MRKEERELVRRKLDRELRFYRLAGRDRNPTPMLLRNVRQALGVRAGEMARKLGVNRSVIFRLEQSEGRGTISLRTMANLADAMECKMVYAVIPQDGKTLEETAERKRWERLLNRGE